MSFYNSIKKLILPLAFVAGLTALVGCEKGIVKPRIHLEDEALFSCKVNFHLPNDSQGYNRQVIIKDINQDGLADAILNDREGPMYVAPEFRSAFHYGDGSNFPDGHHPNLRVQAQTALYDCLALRKAMALEVTGGNQ
ncbi:hypothetical protein J4474_00905 [Candidatus Pacearchaeota archaeon]|nr:hypothetical protein [Candidatus Pacearchaeota archaeon]